MRTLIHGAIALAFIGLGGCSSGAQQPTDPSAEGATQVTVVRAPHEGTPGLAAEGRPPTLAAGASMADRVDVARQITDRLRLRSDRVQRWLRDSRQAKYAQRSSCLDEMLSQAHAVERLGHDSHRAARVAATREDLPGVDRELARLRVFDERSVSLQQRADLCGKADRRMPTGAESHEVRTHRPTLPPEPTVEKRTSSTTLQYSPHVH